MTQIFQNRFLTTSTALLLSTALLSACGQTNVDQAELDKPVEATMESPSAQSGIEATLADKAAADIGNLQLDGKSLSNIKTPEGYKRGDKLIAYEGPGWESNKVGYRLYLDDRNAIDVFGKKTTDIVLNRVGRGEDYHAMADWGMDILKVGNSLGAGGFGVFENGEVRQIGPAAHYEAKILEDTEDMAKLEVIHQASETCGANVKATYEIRANERISRVRISPTCDLPFATGLIIHEGTEQIESTGDGRWQYFARYGAQSLIPDNLGMAIFYKGENIDVRGQDSDDDYIVFKKGVSPDYYLAAAWAQEVDGLKTKREFESWLEAKQKHLNGKTP